eukprot:TRINITY_DN44_c0_g1_i6.p1 TRINITY_DN44_c0_g1~~TRINITY_DN44_c0_g1_i6.p1  ORF type:complete len:374 (-),score=83.33 TRINITY_DN44_c0_g1_i6:270-1391(-)
MSVDTTAADLAECKATLDCCGTPTAYPTLTAEDLDGVDLLKLPTVAAGAEGRVVRGTLHGTPVAIKEVDLAALCANMRLSPELVRPTLAKLVRLHTVLQHPRLVRFHGLHTRADCPNHVWLVFDWCERGTLDTLMKNHGGALCDDDSGLLRRILLQVAQALRFVHSRGLVHRDVKPSNVLVANSDGDVVLADFGLMCAAGTATARATQRYAAPELLLRQPCSPSSDVFAFGLLIVELATGRRPHGLLNDLVASEMHSRGITDAAPLTLQQDLRDLAAACRKANPAERPTMAEIVAVLSTSAPPRSSAAPATPVAPAPGPAAEPAAASAAAAASNPASPADAAQARLRKRKSPSSAVTDTGVRSKRPRRGCQQQ